MMAPSPDALAFTGMAIVALFAAWKLAQTRRAALRKATATSL